MSLHYFNSEVSGKHSKLKYDYCFQIKINKLKIAFVFQKSKGKKKKTHSEYSE